MPNDHAPEGPDDNRITAALRQQIRQELPEIDQISDERLRDQAIEAWAYAIAHSSFSSIREIPPAGNPGVRRGVVTTDRPSSRRHPNGHRHCR